MTASLTAPEPVHSSRPCVCKDILFVQPAVELMGHCQASQSVQRPNVLLFSKSKYPKEVWTGSEILDRILNTLTFELKPH